MAGHNLLPIGAQVGFLEKLRNHFSFEKKLAIQGVVEKRGPDRQKNADILLAFQGSLQTHRSKLLEKPGKPLVFRQGMKGQNLSFIISSIRLFFKKNPIER